ncbi:MAG: DUF559 domain-containing protein [Acidimicrobiia bacterium]
MKLEGIDPGLFELTTPLYRERVDKRLILHTSDRLTNADVAWLGPFRITTPTRTLIDLASVESEEVVEIALQYAVRKGHTSIGRLNQRLESLSGRGRRGIRVMQRLIEVQPSRPVQSVLEVKLLRAIRDSGLSIPATQFEVRDADFHVFLDFAYPEQMVAIEAEGREFHVEPFDFEKDLARRNILTSLGWRVLHVPWDEIVRNPKRVAESIRKLLSV